MILCIHPSVLGTSKYLRYDTATGSYAWVTNISSNDWVFGDTTVPNSLDVILSLYNKNIPQPIPKEYAQSFKALGINNTNIPWHNVLPARKFYSIIQDILVVLSKALEVLHKCPYGETFVAERSLLLGLSRALVDKQLLARYIAAENNPTIKGILRSFLPDGENYAKKVSYDQLATTTGRLTVKSGPSILTLPKRHRDILMSRYPGGSVIQVDFVSLEPRLARLLYAHESSRDLYNEISDNLFNGGLDREHVKIAVLCALYGASANKLRAVLDNQFNPELAISKIKDYFGISDLIAKLRNDMLTSGKIQNFFGRSLSTQSADNNIMVNHYLQSSAVDVSLLGFSNFVKKIMLAELRAQPLFVIHDALVLDVHPDDLSKICKFSEEGLHIDGLGKFPIDIDAIRSPG